MSGSTTLADGVDYGPLAALVGVWEGNKGVDRAPEPDGEERNLFFETITFSAAGDVTNAKKQTLSVVRYHQVVSRKSNNEVFHDQVGYWLWDPSDNTIIETFTIPRGVAVVAGGTLAAPDDLSQTIVFEVAADAKSPTCGIVQAPSCSRTPKPPRSPTRLRSQVMTCGTQKAPFWISTTRRTTTTAMSARCHA